MISSKQQEKNLAQYKKKLEKMNSFNQTNIEYSKEKEPLSSGMRTINKNHPSYSNMNKKITKCRSVENLGILNNGNIENVLSMGLLKEKSDNGKTEQYAEIIQENRDLIKSLKQIEREGVFLTPVKDDKNSEDNSYKRASKTKKTLKVVMEKYKRSPSILFTGPMENIYFLEVFQLFFKVFVM